jgi:hypothetical protein
MTHDLNWAQFARRCPWSPELAEAMKALGVEVPPEGRPPRFVGPGFRVEAYLTDGFLCWRATPGRSCIVAGGDAVLAYLGPISRTSGAGMALWEWLTWWGWAPPPRRGAAAPPPPPPMVI